MDFDIDNNAEYQAFKSALTEVEQIRTDFFLRTNPRAIIVTAGIQAFVTINPLSTPEDIQLFWETYDFELSQFNPADPELRIASNQLAAIERYSSLGRVAGLEGYDLRIGDRVREALGLTLPEMQRLEDSQLRLIQYERLLAQSIEFSTGWADLLTLGLYGLNLESQTSSVIRNALIDYLASQGYLQPVFEGRDLSRFAEVDAAIATMPADFLAYQAYLDQVTADQTTVAGTKTEPGSDFQSNILASLQSVTAKIDSSLVNIESDLETLPPPNIAINDGADPMEIQAALNAYQDELVELARPRVDLRWNSLIMLQSSQPYAVDYAQRVQELGVQQLILATDTAFLETTEGKLLKGGLGLGIAAASKDGGGVASSIVEIGFTIFEAVEEGSMEEVPSADQQIFAEIVAVRQDIADLSELTERRFNAIERQLGQLATGINTQFLLLGSQLDDLSDNVMDLKEGLDTVILTLAVQRSQLFRIEEALFGFAESAFLDELTGDTEFFLNFAVDGDTLPYNSGDNTFLDGVNEFTVFASSTAAEPAFTGLSTNSNVLLTTSNAATFLGSDVVGRYINDLRVFPQSLGLSRLGQNPTVAASPWSQGASAYQQFVQEHPWYYAFQTRPGGGANDLQSIIEAGDDFQTVIDAGRNQDLFDELFDGYNAARDAVVAAEQSAIAAFVLGEDELQGGIDPFKTFTDQPLAIERLPGVGMVHGANGGPSWQIPPQPISTWNLFGSSPDLIASVIQIASWYDREIIQGGINTGVPLSDLVDIDYEVSTVFPAPLGREVSTLSLSKVILDTRPNAPEPAAPSDYEVGEVHIAFLMDAEIWFDLSINDGPAVPLHTITPQFLSNELQSGSNFSNSFFDYMTSAGQYDAQENQFAKPVEIRAFASTGDIYTMRIYHRFRGSTGFLFQVLTVSQFGITFDLLESGFEETGEALADALRSSIWAHVKSDSGLVTATDQLEDWVALIRAYATLSLPDMLLVSEVAQAAVNGRADVTPQASEIDPKNMIDPYGIALSVPVMELHQYNENNPSESIFLDSVFGLDLPQIDGMDQDRSSIAKREFDTWLAVEPRARHGFFEYTLAQLKELQSRPLQLAIDDRYLTDSSFSQPAAGGLLDNDVRQVLFIDQKVQPVFNDIEVKTDGSAVTVWSSPDMTGVEVGTVVLQSDGGFVFTLNQFDIHERPDVGYFSYQTCGYLGRLIDMPPPNFTFSEPAIVAIDFATPMFLSVPDQCDTIMEAISLIEDDASSIIELAPGTYTELIDTMGKAFTLRSASGDPRDTIISGGDAGTVLAITSGEGPDTVIQGITFQDGLNLTAPFGGAVFIDGASPRFESCWFRDSRGFRGGAVSAQDADVTFRNCLFTDNTTPNFGGAFRVTQSTIRLASCTITNNFSGTELGRAYTSTGADSLLVMSNTIISEGVDDPIHIVDGSGFAIRSNVNGGLPVQIQDAGGNIDADPMFNDPSFQDYGLQSGSPSVDAGGNGVAELVGVEFDIFGNPRFVDDLNTPDTGAGTAPIVDMGALEWQPNSCLADLNGDGDLDFLDISEFLAAYSAGEPAADFNGDMEYDFLDISAFLNSYSAGCP